MKRTLAALAVSVLLISGGSASAAPSKPAHCKVLSVQTVQQSRDVTGVVLGVDHSTTPATYTYGHGIQYQTVTTTRSRCRGKVTTVVTLGGWHY